jgi:hypothetical protein
VGPGFGLGHGGVGGFGGEGRGRGPGGGFGEFGEHRGGFNEHGRRFHEHGRGPGGGFGEFGEFGGGRGGEDFGHGPGFGPGFGPDFGPGGGPGGGFGHGPGGIRNIVAWPSAIARGGQLEVAVEGCRNGGVMESRAFPRTPLRPVNAAGERARGIATIRENIRPGTYDITAECDGRRLIRPGAFTVVGGVRGGVGGGTITGAAPADLAIGGGLLTAGAVGGGALWLRRRRPDKRL